MGVWRKKNVVWYFYRILFNPVKEMKLNAIGMIYCEIKKGLVLELEEKLLI